MFRGADMMKAKWVALLAACFAVTAQAQEKTGNKPGFTLAPGTARIALMRPSIKVGEQSTGGLFEPNADWTEQAKANLGKAIAAVQSGLGNAVIPYAEPGGADGALAMEYHALFKAVAASVIEYQFFSGNRLPTKKRKNSFQWTLGAEIAKLPGLAGADYALFITTEDQYGSTGRKMAQVVGALIPGISMPSGVHKGFAGLIDLKSGDLVWLNADLEMGGDVRTEEGAVKRVAQLFEGFPGRAVNGGTSAPALAAPAMPVAESTAAAVAAVGD
jgi:hypothetical protein